MEQSIISTLPDVPARPDDAHKGTFGTVIVVGGCDTMIGAPAIAATAALRSGAGLVKIAAWTELLPFMLTIEPSATGVALNERDAESAAALLDAADPERRAVLAVGPGLGQSDAAKTLFESLRGNPRPMVLDADGLNLLAASGRVGPSAWPCVLTPHPGEFARLARPAGIDDSPTDPATRPAAAAKLAAAHGAVVVLKGRHTVVSDGQRNYVNDTGNPALATAGSGDVLTGLIAALIAQGMTPFDAAALGVHLHGLAADLWHAEHGPSGLTARDLCGRLPTAFNHHRHATKGMFGFSRG